MSISPYSSISFASCILELYYQVYKCLGLLLINWPLYHRKWRSLISSSLKPTLIYYSSFLLTAVSTTDLSPFSFILLASLYSKCVSCRQLRVGSYFLLWSDNLSSNWSVYSIYYGMIIDIRFKFIISPFAFYLFLLFFVPFSSFSIFFWIQYTFRIPFYLHWWIN